MQQKWPLEASQALGLPTSTVGLGMAPNPPNTNPTGPPAAEAIPPATVDKKASVLPAWPRLLPDSSYQGFQLKMAVWWALPEQ